MLKYYLSTAIITILITLFPQRVLSGTVRIFSSPSGAEIYLDGKKLNLITPSIINIDDTLKHEIELRLPHHIFTKRVISLKKDTSIDISVNLISPSDSAIIIGDLELGILSLTPPPLKIPYEINDKKIYTKDAILNAGLHHVKWNGGEIYSSLDTIVNISSGKMTVMKFYPQRLSGNISLRIIPDDAVIFLNGIQYGTGSVNVSVNTGLYNLSVKRNGFVSYDTLVTIKPNSADSNIITLLRIPDEDRDGYLDSVDLCPKVYGLYDGCPKQKKSSAVKKYFSMLGKNLKNQRFSLSLDLIKWTSKTAINKKESEFLSYFNDSKALFNNYRNFSLLNKLETSFRGAIIAVEVGQYRQGLRYKKDHNLGNGPTLIKIDKSDTTQYCLFYDSLGGVEPSIFIPSVNLQGGINFRMNKFDLTLLLGYQWERLIYRDIIAFKDYLEFETNNQSKKNIYTGPKHNWEIDSDWIFAGINLSYNLLKWKRNNLLLYCGFKVSFHDATNIQWSSISAGFKYKLIPGIKKDIGISTQKKSK